MEAKDEYQYVVLRALAREVQRQGIEGFRAHEMIAWKLRAMSQQLSQARCYTQAMWVRLLASEVHNAGSVNVVWVRLRAAKSAEPPTSNRGVNLVVETVVSLCDG